LGEYFHDLAVACGGGGGDVVSCFISMSGHILGGAYGHKDSDATAFYHRNQSDLLGSSLVCLAMSSFPSNGLNG